MECLKFQEYFLRKPYTNMQILKTNGYFCIKAIYMYTAQMWTCFFRPEHVNEYYLISHILVLDLVMTWKRVAHAARYMHDFLVQVTLGFIWRQTCVNTTPIGPYIWSTYVFMCIWDFVSNFLKENDVENSMDHPNEPHLL